MVDNLDEIIKLNLDYQDYSTYLGVIWTVAISLFIAIFSYILISSQTINIINLIILGLILISLLIIFIALHFYINYGKQFVRNRLYSLKGE